MGIPPLKLSFIIHLLKQAIILSIIFVFVNLLSFETILKPYFLSNLRKTIILIAYLFHEFDNLGVSLVLHQ